ncbi:MAG TPA: phosphodiesterase [Acetobacteraceae bacterium]
MIIVHLTDLHVRPYGLSAMRTAETNMLTERALRAVRDLRPRPDALVISGDLTNNGLPEEYACLAEMLGRLVDIPIYVIPGNHDDRENLRAGLSHLPGVNAHPRFVQYAVDDLPVRLVMLDTFVPGSAAGELCAERLAWLDETLAAVPEKPTMVVMHHPSFPCGIRHMDRIILADPDAFTAVIARHKQVLRVLAGHHHRQITSHVAHAVGIIGPGVAHVVELELFSDNPGFWTLEPAAFLLHAWVEGAGVVTHTALVERYPGPYPFNADV